MCSYFSPDWRSWESERDEQSDFSRKQNTNKYSPSSCPTWHSRNWAGEVLDWVCLQNLQLQLGTNFSVAPEIKKNIPTSQYSIVRTPMQSHFHWNMEL